MRKLFASDKHNFLDLFESNIYLGAYGFFVELKIDSPVLQRLLNVPVSIKRSEESHLSAYISVSTE